MPTSLLPDYKVLVALQEISALENAPNFLETRHGTPPLNEGAAYRI
jgi:hypothetical protein